MDNSKVLVLDAATARKIKCLTQGEVLTSKKTDKSEPFDYRRYRYNGIVFNVKEEEGFLEELKNGTVFEATLITGTRTVDIEGTPTPVPTIEFDSFVTAKQQFGLINMLGGIKKLQREYDAPIVAPKLDTALA